MGAEKQEKATFSIFSAPIFLPVDDAKADKRDQPENCWKNYSRAGMFDRGVGET
jgi:hypothetical protein